MTVNRGLFVLQNGEEGTTPLEARRAFGGLFVENSPGNPRSGLLEPPSPTVVSGTADMSYNVGQCTAVVNRAATEGVYCFTLTGTTNVPTTAAPGTDKRYDLIWVKQLDIEKSDTLGGVLSNKGTVGVTQGSVAASPVKPYTGVPEGAYVLAEALVSAGTTATNQGTVTISQVWSYAGLKGAPLWLRGDSEKSAITPHIGMKIQNLTNGYEERWNGSAWVSEAPKLQHAFYQVTQASVPNASLWGPGMPSQLAGRSINGGFVTFSEADWISVNEEGLYTVTLQVTVAGGFGSGGFVSITSLAGNVLASTQGTAQAGGISTTVNAWLKPGSSAPGGVLQMRYFHNNGASSAVTAYIQVSKVA